MKNFELISFATADELAAAAATAWLDDVAATNHFGKPHSVALSGGRITQKFFASVVNQAKERAISLGLVQFFWADERCVPESDPESNFKMANDLLFAPLKISEAQIHRIRGELSPEMAASHANSDIHRTVAPNAAGIPVLDIVFLGMGEDGHVASLFPNEAVDAGTKTPFRAITNSPKPPPNRVTLDYSTLAAARQVWVLASGSAKESALRESIFENGKTPLARTIQGRSTTKIFTDIRLA